MALFIWASAYSCFKQERGHVTYVKYVLFADPFTLPFLVRYPAHSQEKDKLLPFPASWLLIPPLKYSVILSKVQVKRGKYGQGMIVFYVTSVGFLDQLVHVAYL